MDTAESCNVSFRLIVIPGMPVEFIADAQKYSSGGNVLYPFSQTNDIAVMFPAGYFFFMVY